MDLTITFTGYVPEDAVATMKAVTALLKDYRVLHEYILMGQEAPGDVPASVDGAPVRVAGASGDTYGAQLRLARDLARGKWLLTLDEPSEDDASLVFSFWHRRDEGDLLVASRYVRGGSYRMPWLRRTLSRGLNHLYRAGLSVPIHDLSSARRMYRLDILRRLEIHGEDYDVLMETLLKVMAKGGVVAEVPWHYESTERRQAPGTTMRLVRSSLATFWQMFALRNSVDFPDYDYRAYDSRIWLQRYWQRSRFEIIREFTGFHPRVLDAGCGSSHIITTRPEMVALDINFNRLRHLKKTNPRRVQATAGALPFPDAYFDAVISSQVIEHTAERTCIEEAVRVLRPEGTLVLGTPDYGTFWWPITEKIYGWVKRGGYADEHITHYTYASLEEELTKLGCDIVAHRYIGGGELIIKARKRHPSV